MREKKVFPSRGLHSQNSARQGFGLVVGRSGGRGGVVSQRELSVIRAVTGVQTWVMMRADCGDDQEAEHC